MALDSISKAASGYETAKKTPPPAAQAQPVKEKPAQETKVQVKMPEMQRPDIGKQIVKEDEEQNEQKNNGTANKMLQDAVNQVSDSFKANRTACKFTYHEKTRQVSIKIYDEVTKEVIREIPPEESIRMVEKMWEIAGLLVDEKR